MSLNARHIPNVLTVFRLCMVPLLSWQILVHQYLTALVVAVVAGLTDAADGYLAKRFGWVSRLGSVLDPLADKLLMITAFAALAWVGLLPWWLIVLTVVRDSAIVTGGLIYHYTIEPVEAQPTLLSKLNTTMQVLLVAVTLIRACCVAGGDWLSQALIVIVATLTAVTLVQYVWIWSMKAVRIKRHGVKTRKQYDN